MIGSYEGKKYFISATNSNHYHLIKHFSYIFFKKRNIAFTGTVLVSLGFMEFKNFDGVRFSMIKLN